MVKKFPLYIGLAIVALLTSGCSMTIFEYSSSATKTVPQTTKYYYCGTSAGGYSFNDQNSNYSYISDW